MSSQAFDTLIHLDLWVLPLALLGLFYFAKEIIEAIQYIANKIGIEKKSDIEKRELKESVDKLYTSVERVDKKLDQKIDKLRDDIDLRINEMKSDINEVSKCNQNIAEASREELADKINLKYKLYFKQGYIPLDEYDEFVKLHNAYKLVGGNHSGDAKFKKCCELLEIRDDSPETSVLNCTITEEEV